MWSLALTLGKGWGYREIWTNGKVRTGGWYFRPHVYLLYVSGV